MSESQGTLSFGKASLRSEGLAIHSGPTPKPTGEGSTLSLVAEATELSAEDAGIEDGGKTPISEEEYATFEMDEHRPTNSPLSGFSGDARGKSSSRERSTWALKQTATAPDFLTKFYQQSRLHWLSTWKAELRDMVACLNEERELQPKEGKWPRTHDIFQKRRAESRRRVIMVRGSDGTTVTSSSSCLLCHPDG
ncbi:MAG: hypothetical protein BJ554DRAFT_6971 [Olpidium bornovanus]|uniref:Uncharacterized protein n=1 Tax=Olpidium bornovanus TaxID=278681 RepID=A0A8H8DJT4_9FUNG|nr:MAG: hypothetical protein BJ554DRAFT_6971 [Olpidium bornovanus]